MEGCRVAPAPTLTAYFKYLNYLTCPYMDTQTWKWNGPVPVPTPAGDVSVGGKGEISRITSAYLYSSQEGHADGVT